MKRTFSLLGSLCIIIAAMMWAFDGIFLTPSLFHLDVVVVVFLLHAFGFVYMIFILFLERKELQKMRWKDWGVFFLVALFGGALGTLAITKALFYVNFVPLTIVVLLQKLQPVFAIVMSLVLLHEQPPRIFYLYAILALIGSYIITFGFSFPVFDVGNKLLLASGLSLVAAFSFGSSTVFSKRALQVVNYKMGTVLRYGLTTLIMFVFIGTFNKWADFQFITTNDIFIFIIIALTTGGLAIFLYYYGLKKVLASQSTILELAFPVTAILLDYIIHHTVLSLPQWCGVVILLISITKIAFLQQRKDNRE